MYSPREVSAALGDPGVTSAVQAELSGGSLPQATQTCCLQPPERRLTSCSSHCPINGTLASLPLEALLLLDLISCTLIPGHPSFNGL